MPTKTKAKTVAKKTPVKKTPVKKTATAKRVAPVADAPVVTPQPEIGLKTALRNFFAKYFDFNGTATRSEYWWIILFGIFTVILGIGVLPFAALAIGGPFFTFVAVGIMWAMILFILAVAIPSAALLARRIHDAGFSAWVFFGPWIIVNVIQFVTGLYYGHSFMLVELASYAISIWGFILALMPGKLTNNPYRK